MTKEPAVFPMQKHTQFINLIAEKIKAKKYLEIGVYDPDHNFDRINVDDKVSVDPDPKSRATCIYTSDEFFYRMDSIYSDINFDLIFIDGLHHADQVKRDIINSWEYLYNGGVLIIHDSNPHSERITHVPRDNREWCGDVYKTICQIDEPEFFTLKDDYGVTVIRKEGELRINDDKIEWDEFDRMRGKLLNLKTWDECVKIIDNW